MNSSEKINYNNWWEKKKHEVRENIKKVFSYHSIMNVTDIEKIVLNCGVGKYSFEQNKLENTSKSLELISFGQKPILTHSKKSIVNFKIRENIPIGCKITLRKKRAWNFFFELINVALPRTPNFRGISEDKFDKFGNFNLGIKNLSIFPTINYDLTFRNQGLQITIVFKSMNKKENLFFLDSFGFPFEKKK